MITPQIIDPGKIKLTPKSAFEQNDNHQLFLAIAPKLGIQVKIKCMQKNENKRKFK